VGVDDVIGIVGATAFGGAFEGPHLHFEVKSFGTLGTDDDDRGEFGYTPDHPDRYGFRDPMLEVHATSDEVGDSLRVTASGSGARLRVWPGPYRVVRGAQAGEEFLILRSAAATEDPLCGRGWYQIEATGGSAGTGVVRGIPYFLDSGRPPSSVPDLWVCAGSAQEVWLLPLQPTNGGVSVSLVSAAREVIRVACELAPGLPIRKSICRAVGYALIPGIGSELRGSAQEADSADELVQVTKAVKRKFKKGGPRRGQTELKLRLNRKGKLILRRQGTLEIYVRVMVQDGAGNSSETEERVSLRARK
jgi:hypothetical protein